MKKKKNTDAYDAIVLGAGMAGLNTAIALGRRGKRVLVITRDRLRGESTPAAAGILDPFLEIEASHPVFPLMQESFRAYPNWVRDLEARTGIETGYAKTGMLYAAFTHADVRLLETRLRWQEKTDVFVEWHSRDRILKDEPEVSEAVLGGLFYPTIARIHPRRLIAALRKDAFACHVTIEETQEEFSVRVENGRVTGVFSRQRAFEAPVVVNAAGAWAGRNRRFLVTPPVYPVRGQIQIAKGKMKIRSILHTVDGGYIVPWSLRSSASGAEFLLGSTVEKGKDDPDVTPAGMALVQKKCRALVPGLEGCKIIDRWAGLRPGSRTGRPHIGPAGMEGLYVAAGYYRSGILIGPRAGELLAEGIVTGKMPAALQPFLPGAA